MKNSKRRRKTKLLREIDRIQEADERVNAAEKEKRRRDVLQWPREKRRRWCEKHG
jgi:hypothetical protein